MALDGLTMGFLAREINDLLLGARVDKVSQPDDDLLILALRNQGKTHRMLLCATPGYTRVHLTQKTYENPVQAPMFCMLARKHLQGGRFLGVEQLYGDRLLRLAFSTLDELGDQRETLLYFEGMGKHSNLTLVQDGKILDALRHVTLDMSRVRQMLPGLSYVMPPRQDKLAPEDATAIDILTRMEGSAAPLNRFLFHHIAGLGAQSALELAQRLNDNPEQSLQEMDLPKTASALSTLLKVLPGMAAPGLLLEADGTPESALPFAFLSQPASRQVPAASLSLALETLYFERDLRNRFNQRAAGLRRTINQAVERLKNKLAALEEDVLTEQQAEEVRMKGELLTASLHLVPRGAKEISLPNYYTGGDLLVALDETLSPAQNAQRYFKHYRKAHTARKLAGEQKQQALDHIAQYEDALYFLEEATSSQEISEIRAWLVECGLLRREGGQKGKKKESPSQPLRFRSRDGFDILVGRNSHQNEQLLKQAQGEDLWFHAKGLPGSHVLVLAQGKQVPEGTLLLAARLAAYYSKAKGRQTQVDYTRRKLVKKTPGGAPGLVNYTGEKGLLVSMSEGERAALGTA